MLLVTLSWPSDPDRGIETYGGFESDIDRDKWIKDCRDAAEAGWTLLQGTVYRLHDLFAPFDPNSLLELQEWGVILP